MTPDKIKENHDLWEIASDVDDIAVELERLQYMLQILDENLEDEVLFLRKASGGCAVHFVDRYNMHRAQLEMVEIWLHKTREDLEKLSPAIRSQIKITEVPA